MRKFKELIAEAKRRRLAGGAKAGFTIVELLMVIGVIGILMTIVTTAALGSLKNSRAQRADALCQMVQEGISAYNAQYHKWPGSIGDSIANGTLSSGNMNSEGFDGYQDSNIYVLSASEVKDMIFEIIKAAKNDGNAVMDISGLYVSRNPGESNDKGHGMSFTDAIRGTKKNPVKMKASEMYFGYQDPATGYFRRFKIVYSIPTDKMNVSRQ